jgi:hypothetical protein
MGVNLVTRVRNFYIQSRTFTASDHDVQDGCVTPGNHRLLRFDFLSHNAGNADLVVGSPAARPDLFVWSSGHGHYHLKDFNEFLLFRPNGTLATVGYKQAFCAIDIERISPTASPSGRFHDCNSDQGISAGWADVYSSGLACQFIVIDGVPDGDYTLQSTTNAKHKVGEDCFGDNTIWTGLRLAGNNVTTIDPPFIPEDRIPFDRSRVSAQQVGGRWKVVENNSHWMLDTGTSPWEAQRAVQVINHYKLASMCFVGRPRCGDVEPMMYWLNDSGRAPTGSIPEEDCLPFDRDHLRVVQIGDRWKIVEGTHWLMDFGPGQGNAVAALHFIRKHRFDSMCFIGRPGPSMTYFKTKGRRPEIVIQIDPRRLDVTLDDPRWRRELDEAANELAPTVDLTDACVGDGPATRSFGRIEIEVADQETSSIVQVHGVTGLSTAGRTEIRLGAKAGVVDLGLAHFGGEVTIEAYAGTKKTAEELVDPITRHFQNIRLVAPSIDRIVITSAGAYESPLLGYIRFQPKVRTPARPAK